MSDPYALPDPLPPLLPGESRSQYRHRVIPGFTEWDALGRKWTKLKAAYAKAARKHERDHYAALDTAWAEWCDSDPVAAERFAELSALVGWVAFEPDPVPADTFARCKPTRTPRPHTGVWPLGRERGSYRPLRACHLAAVDRVAGECGPGRLRGQLARPRPYPVGMTQWLYANIFVRDVRVIGTVPAWRLTVRFGRDPASVDLTTGALDTMSWLAWMGEHGYELVSVETDWKESHLRGSSFTSRLFYFKRLAE